MRRRQVRRLEDAYTRYPRPLLWLVPGDDEIPSFYLSKLPVTNVQFEAFDPGHLRAPTSPGDGDPALGVSFEAARGYCDWYAGVARKPMRLPSEDEWLHACRGGVESFIGYADPDERDMHVWHAGNAPDARVPALDAKRANPLGFYGLLGGVWEWTSGDAGTAVLRGGSWRTPPAVIGVALRRVEATEARFDDAGFRLAKPLR